MNRKETKERDTNSRQKASLWEWRGTECARADLAQWIDRAIACGPKSPRLDSRQGHILGLRARFPSGGGGGACRGHPIRDSHH